MRPLFVDDVTKSRVLAVREFAERQENHYHPSPTARIPGDDPKFVAQLDTYRCVFTITAHEEQRFRHLSISVPSKHFPSPPAVFTIAALFGFTGGKVENDFVVGPGSDWQVAIDKDQHCVVVAQELPTPKLN